MNICVFLPFSERKASQILARKKRRNGSKIPKKITYFMTLKNICFVAHFLYTPAL